MVGNMIDMKKKLAKSAATEIHCNLAHDQNHRHSRRSAVERQRLVGFADAQHGAAAETSNQEKSKPAQRKATTPAAAFGNLIGRLRKMGAASNNGI